MRGSEGFYIRVTWSGKRLNGIEVRFFDEMFFLFDGKVQDWDVQFRFDHQPSEFPEVEERDAGVQLVIVNVVVGTLSAFV